VNILVSEGPGRWLVRFERTGELQNVTLKSENFSARPINSFERWRSRVGHWDFLGDFSPRGNLSHVALILSKRRKLRVEITRSIQNLDYEFILRLRQIGVQNAWYYLCRDDIVMYRELYSEFKRTFRRTTMTDVEIFECIDQIDARFQRYEFEHTNAGYKDVSYTGRSLQNAFMKFARKSGLDDEILVKNEYKPLSLSHNVASSKVRHSSTLNYNDKNGSSSSSKSSQSSKLSSNGMFSVSVSFFF